MQAAFFDKAQRRMLQYIIKNYHKLKYTSKSIQTYLDYLGKPNSDSECTINQNKEVYQIVKLSSNLIQMKALVKD